MNDLQKLMDHTLREVWENGKPIGEVSIQKRFTKVYEELIREGVLRPETWEYKLMALQTVGGECPVCKKPWVEKKCNPVFTQKGANQGMVVASYMYFVPSCGCIMHCPMCGTPQLAEFYEERTMCLTCGHKIQCQNWVDKSEGYGNTKTTKRARCDGYYRPAVGRWVCDVCGDEKIIHIKEKGYEKVS